MSQTNRSIVQTAIVHTSPCEVQVYLSRGMLKREGTVSFKKGINDIYIPMFSLSLNSDIPSILFDKDVTIESVQILPEIPAEVLENADKEAALNEAQEEITLLNREIKTKELMHSFLVKSADNIFSLKDISFKEASEYLESLPDKLKKIDSELDELKKEMQKAMDKAEKCKQQKQGLINKPSCLRVLVFSTEDVEARITLELIEGNVKWVPCYRISTNGDRNKINVSMRGRISQITRSDWKNVKLVLSTGSPSRLLQKPQLRKISLSLRRPGMFSMSENTANSYPAPGSRHINSDMFEGTADNSSLIFDAPSSSFEPVTENLLPPVGIKANETTVDFVLPGTYDVPANGNPTMVDIQEFEIPVEFINTVYPTASPDAALTAKFIENRHYNLPAGDADLFLDDVYIGKVHVKPSSWQENAELDFGSDKQIQVKREIVKSNHMNVRLSGNERTMYEYSYEYVNKKDSPVDVTIMDQVPVSSDREISVDVTALSGGTLEDETGFITWEKRIEPGESGRFMLKYQITSPKGKYVWENV